VTAQDAASPTTVTDLALLAGGLTVHDLEHDRYVGAPIYPGHWPGYVYSLHRRHEVVEDQARTSASGLVTMAEHSGTHIDALCHQARDMEMHGGLRVDATVQTPRGFTELGVETIPPIMRRGVLLDVSALHGGDHLPAGHLVTGDDLQAAADALGTEIRPGDCILVRTPTPTSGRPVSAPTARAGSPPGGPTCAAPTTSRSTTPSTSTRTSARCPATPC
jgi:kynurenine formamidase